MGNIYNIKTDKSFVDELAAFFLKRYENEPDKLSSVLFLLPNRRSCQNLKDAFIRQKGLQPTILPRIEPISEVEDTEIFLRGNLELLSKLHPQINDLERLFLFTRLILQKPQEHGLKQISLSQAYALASNLANLMDLAYYEELDFSKIKDIVPSEFSGHWQETLKLLEIITQYWPNILNERGCVDGVYRRICLLNSEIEIWKQNKEQQKIVIAGTTAAFPILKKLVKTVLELPKGEVFLAGLDKYLNEDEWDQVDENHSQYELKELLSFLKLNREEIPNLNESTNISPRSKLVSEIMRPAISTGKWRDLSKEILPSSAFEGIKIINCGDIRQEALAISMIIRQTLETPEKTVALITSDRNLSRRVVSELKRWNIDADDSAGKPLSLSTIGIYLRLIINVLENNFSKISILSLLKHPFTSCGLSRNNYKNIIYHLECAWRKNEELNEEQQSLLDNFYSKFRCLSDLYGTPSISLREFFEEHIKLAESLAETHEKSGDKIIWKGEDGRVATKFISEFLEKIDILGKISPNDYLPFLVTLMQQQNIRNIYNSHPRVKILGPIEARLMQFDVNIIGEVNEGCWPKLPDADMWMSRPMKKDFGLPLPERNIGVLAADFSHLLHAREVYLTRADRVDGSPTNKSRWLLRLETILSANFEDREQYDNIIMDYRYSYWSKYFDRAEKIKKINPPAPCPDVAKRPRKLSASNLEMLMRDPYSVFARHILKLYPLDDLDKDLELRDYGNIIHEIIEEFNNKHNSSYPINAKEELLKIGEHKFLEKEIKSEVRAFWWPKFVKTVEWLDNKEKEYRKNIQLIHNEVNGEIKMSAPAGDFTITAKADRIDETKDGNVNIIDYKTGRMRSLKEVITGMAPQLSIEGIIAQQGGFHGIEAKPVNTMNYWKLGEKELSVDEEDSEAAINLVYDRLQKLVSIFDFPTTPYLSKPNPSIAPSYSDYDHLSRYLEWSIKEDTYDN